METAQQQYDDDLRRSDAIERSARRNPCQEMLAQEQETEEQIEAADTREPGPTAELMAATPLFLVCFAE